MVRFLFSLVITSALFTSCKEVTISSKSWKPLLDKDLSQWEIFLGIPHGSSGIPGYKNITDVKKGIPLGLNKNTNTVFSIIKEDGEEVLKITGEIFGSLATKKEYENYRLKFQFKWGEKRWQPRLESKRNSGVLYHSIGAHGAGLWNVWMSSLEFEVQETDCGDFITINDANVKAKCPSVKKEDGSYYFNANAPLQDFCWKRYDSGRCWKSIDAEKPHGEWNTLELICYKDMALHIVNGKVVMAVYEPRFFDGNDWIPMNKGKIQIQSEAAEVYYKNIQIKRIDDLDEEFKKYLK